MGPIYCLLDQFCGRRSSAAATASELARKLRAGWPSDGSLAFTSPLALLFSAGPVIAVVIGRSVTPVSLSGSALSSLLVSTSIPKFFASLAFPIRLSSTAESWYIWFINV